MEEADTNKKKKREDNRPFLSDDSLKIIFEKLQVNENGIKKVQVYGEESLSPPYNELGKGSFGVVSKKIIPTRNNLVVAYKEFKNLTKKDDQDKFIYEVEIMDKVLGNDNVVKLFGYTPYGLLLEYCNQGTLKNWLNRERSIISVREMIGYAEDICSGMDFLHQKGVIHRDLKPDNILLDDFRAKITDFGESKLYQDNEPTDLTNLKSSKKSGMKGAEFYRSPESFPILIPYSPPKYTAKRDVYSFGIILWEILTGGLDPNLNDDKNSNNNLMIQNFASYMKIGKRPVIQFPENFDGMDGLKGELEKIINSSWSQNESTRLSFKVLYSTIRKLVITNMPQSIKRYQKFEWSQ